VPGWPSTDRAYDQRLVEALRRVDAHAPAELYDAYAERLHDYACSLLDEPATATEAVHDALVSAHECVRRLAEPGRLRAWLYALTRFQCLTRARATPPHGTSPPAPDPYSDVYPDQDDGSYDTEDPELHDLVHEVSAELDRAERETLELSLRHNLAPAEVAAVLRLTSRQVTAQLGRARDQLENAAAAVLLARTGRAHCPDLSAMVDSWEGPLTPMLRRRLSGHVSGCEICVERKRRQVSAARLLDLVPPELPPLSLRRRVIDTCVSPDREQTRTLISRRNEHVDKAGFPIMVERRSRRRPRRMAPVLVAAGCVLAAAGVVIVLSGAGDHGPAGNAQAAPTDDGPPVFTFDPDSVPEEEAEQEELPDESPEPSRTRTPPAVPTTAPPSRATGPSASRSPRASRRPAPEAGPRLSISCPGDLGESGMGRIELAARGKAVAWSAKATGGVSVSPPRGSVRAGRGVGIWVTVADPGQPGAGRVFFRSASGNSSCVITWSGQDGAPDPPTDPPVNPPSDEPSEPTETPSAESSSDIADTRPKAR
jgi:RNA polymerase sigma factor (sigma-70 family)